LSRAGVFLIVAAAPEIVAVRTGPAVDRNQILQNVVPRRAAVRADNIEHGRNTVVSVSDAVEEDDANEGLHSDVPVALLAAEDATGGSVGAWKRVQFLNVVEHVVDFRLQTRFANYALHGDRSRRIPRAGLLCDAAAGAAEHTRNLLLEGRLVREFRRYIEAIAGDVVCPIALRMAEL